MDNPSDLRVALLLQRERRIAVVGLSSNPERPSYNVARYLLEYGYEIVPVNPNENEVFGLRAYSRLSDVPGHIDVVNVFRRSIFVPEIARAAVAVKAGALWTQLGVVHEHAAVDASRAGLLVVMDRCILVEHARLVLHGARSA